VDLFILVSSRGNMFNYMSIQSPLCPFVFSPNGNIQQPTIFSLDYPIVSIIHKSMVIISNSEGIE
jgi:hypothetical protein